MYFSLTGQFLCFNLRTEELTRLASECGFNKGLHRYFEMSVMRAGNVQNALSTIGTENIISKRASIKLFQTLI